MMPMVQAFDSHRRAPRRSRGFDSMDQVIC
jgi:hypothetical protein